MATDEQGDSEACFGFSTSKNKSELANVHF